MRKEKTSTATACVAGGFIKRLPARSKPRERAMKPRGAFLLIWALAASQFVLAAYTRARVTPCKTANYARTETRVATSLIKIKKLLVSCFVSLCIFERKHLALNSKKKKGCVNRCLSLVYQTIRVSKPMSPINRDTRASHAKRKPDDNT